MLGFPILYFEGRRLMMFQLSGFYCSYKNKTTPNPDIKPQGRQRSSRPNPMSPASASRTSPKNCALSVREGELKVLHRALVAFYKALE